VCTWVSQVDITQLREAQQALLEVEQARVAELVKANEALRNAIAGLARLDNLDSFLAEMLKVSLEVSGAHGGTVCLIERDMVRHAVLFDKAGWVSPEVQAERGTLLLPFSPELRLMAQRILESEDAWAVLPDDPLHPPSFQAFHREQGNRAIRLVPMRIGNRLLGWLGLGFAQEDPPLGRSFALLRVLAEQMTMAVEMLRLAEEAKQSALAKLNEVIACEREKAATQRAAELAKANDALRRGVERLVASGTLDAALDAFLLEAMSVTEAAAGAILERGTGSEFIMQALAQDGKIVKPFDPHSSEDLYRKRTAADPTGVMRRTAAGEIVIIPVEDIESWFPEAAAYHRNCGHRTVWHFPFQVGGEVVGFLGLAFREAKSPNDVLRETVQALAHQASLALESQRLAERAKLAAIAQEQERAASERAAELAKANEALKRSLTMLALEPSLDKLLGYVLQAISDSLGDRSGAVYLFDDSDNTTTLHLNYENGQMQQGEQIDHPAATLRRPPKEWDTQYLPLLRQNQVLIHHEAEFASPAYNPYRQHNAQRGIKTLLFVPLLFGEQLLGSITLRSTQHRNYTPEELELARALAHQATLAIQLTRLAAQGCKQAILEERNRMARDIHDSLAQAFTGIILQLEAAKRKIAATQPEAAQNCLSRARSLAASGLSEARRSVRALRPEALESDDLPSALYYIVEQMSWNTDVKITLQIDGTPRPIPIDVEINLLRIGQEALTNAVRHADAQNIRLNLLFEPEAVHLQIRDDGRGFQPQVQLTNGGFGLIGMQERSRQIGAQLRLVSSIGRGTEAIVTVPV
jgi:signal transduction histidine kinase